MSFNTERLDALTYHMGKKEADLQAELKDYLQKLYEKYGASGNQGVPGRPDRQGGKCQAVPSEQAEECRQAE